MAQADEYTVNLDANTRGYQQQMGTAVTATQGLTAALAAAGAQMQNLFKQADRKLTFITAANVATLTAAGLAAAQLDQQMSQLQARQVMLNKETQNYGATVAGLRRDLGLTATDAITLVTQLNRMNVSFGMQKQTATEYAKLSAVTGENINGLAQSQQQFMRTMGTSQATVGRYSSMIAGLNQNYGAGAQATLEFANSIAPLSKTMGMSTQQITGISAAFSKAGADGGAAANVYTKILSDINRAIQYGSPNLEVYSDLLGKSVEQFKAMPKAQVITEIFETLNQEGPKSIKTLERLGLEGVRSQRAIQQVVGQGGLRTGITEAGKGWQDQGPFNKASQEAMNGFLDTMGKAGQSMQVFAQGIGSTFLPAMGKMAEGINVVVGPLGRFGSLLAQMPDWQKSLAGLALAAGALAPLLPKLILGLGGLPAAASALGFGSMGQGFRLGRTPSRALSPAQRTYMEGGGNPIYRALFGGAMGIGDLLNPGGRRGRLDDLEFRRRSRDGTPGDVRSVVSTRAWLRDRGVQGLMGAGILPGDFDDRQRERRRRLEERLASQRGERSLARRAASRVAQGAAGLALENYRPLTPNYMMNSAQSSDRGMYLTGWGGAGQERGAGEAFRSFGQNIGDRFRFAGSQAWGGISAAARQLNPWQGWTQAGAQTAMDDRLSRRGDSRLGALATSFESTRFGSTFTPEMFQASKQGMREHAQAAREAAKNIRYDSAGMKNSLGDMTKAISETASEALKSAGNFTKAGVGVAGGTVGGAVRGAGSALARGVGGIVSALGPVGIAMGAAAGIGSIFSAQSSSREAIREAGSSGEDTAAGHEYREALGEAAQQTKTFAQVMEETSGLIFKASTSVSDAITVSAADIAASAGRTAESRSVREGSREDVQAYAASVLATASPGAAEKLKQDVTARFGQDASGILQGAYQGRYDQTNAYRPLNRSNQQKLPIIGTAFSDIYLSKENQANAELLAGTLSGNLATGQAQGGAVGRARAGQANLAAYGRATYEAAKGGEGGAYSGSGRLFGSPEGRSRTEAILTSYGIDKEDKESRKSFNKAVAEFGKAQEKAGKEATPEQIDKLWQDALTGNLEGTALGAALAKDRSQGGGIVAGPLNAPMYNQALVGLENFGSQALVNRYRASGTAGDVATDINAPANQGGMNAAGYVQQALGAEGNAAYTQQGIRAEAASTLTAFGGDYDQAIASMQALGNSAGAADEKFRQLVAASEELLVSQRNFARQMGGQTTLNDRLGFAAQEYQTAQKTYQQDPSDPLNEERLAKAKAGNQEAMGAANEYVQGLYMQFRALDRQREQGEDQLARTRERQLRDYGLQSSYQLQDFQRQQQVGLESFNRQRGRAEEDFNRQRKRSIEDYNRSRMREEKDHQTQLVRMAEDTSKSIYTIYQRVNVASTWSAQGVLQNLEDQNRRIAEQQENLAKARKLGLSDETITQMGLNESANAQQLSRLVGDLQEDPKLVAQFNKTVRERVKKSGKLMRDASNDEYQRGEADRKKNLGRQDEDFYRGLDRGRKDFNRSMKRMRIDFGIQADLAIEQFDLMRERQRAAMDQGWKDMNEDFDIQMDIQEKNISFFAEQIGVSFEKAAKTVGERTTGITHDQVTAMTGMMSTLKTTVVTSIQDMDKEVRKPFDQWNVNVNSTQAGAHGPGGSHAAIGGATTMSAGSGGNNSPSVTSSSTRVWPTASHASTSKGGAAYGQRGKWSGSKSLGPGFHSGTDFPNPTGTNIFAAADGTVVFKGGGGAYGNLTKISHGNGLQTWYAHQNSQSVGQGDHVSAGEKIGAVGQTGNASGPHLHFEVRVNGYDKDPLKWLKNATLSGTPGGGGGGGGGGGPSGTPDFANMKSVKAFEDLLGKMSFFDKTRKFMHTSTMFTRGALGAGMAKAFDDAIGTKYGSSGPGGVIDSGGKGGARGVWNALRTAGLTEKQAAGVMGNIQAESSFNWKAKQNPGTGYGLVQWSPGSKLFEILKKGNKKDSLENQIWALFHQLSGKAPYAEPAAGSALRKANSVLDATRAFMLKYERPGNQSESNVLARNRLSEALYKQFKGSSTPGGSPNGGNLTGPKGARIQKALDFANAHEGHQYQFGTMWDCSGFMSQLQNIIVTGKTGGRRYATPSFHGSSAEGFDRNAKSAFMIGVNPSPGRQGHMAGHLDGHAVESSGSHGVRVDSGSSGKNQRIFSWFGGLRGYASGTPSARPGWALVGEKGYEFIKLKGGEEVLNHNQSKMAAMTGKVGQQVSPGIITNNVSYDHSVRVDHVEVVSNDPKALLRQMEAEARMAALTAPRSAK